MVWRKVSRPGVGDENAGVDAFCAQALGQQADMVLDPAYDWKIVLVQQQHSHGPFRRRSLISGLKLRYPRPTRS